MAGFVDLDDRDVRKQFNIIFDIAMKVPVNLHGVRISTFPDEFVAPSNCDLTECKKRIEHDYLTQLILAIRKEHIKGKITWDEMARYMNPLTNETYFTIKLGR